MVFMKKDNIIPFKVLKSKHLFCKINLNDLEAKFIIDTGASNTCIDKNKIDHFKLVSNKKEMDVSGAGKEKLKVTPTKKSVLSLNKIVLMKINVMLLDMSSINNSLKKENSIEVDGILGADFLIKTKSIINYKLKKIFLDF